MSVKITIRVPRELKERMDRLSDVNWSDVLRRAIEDKLCEEEAKRALEIMERIRRRAEPGRASEEVVREFRDKRWSRR